MSTQITTGKVRFSYCNLFTPRAVQEGATPKYSVTLLIPKSDKATMQKIKAAMDEAKQKFMASNSGKKLPTNLKSTLHDGDGERPNGGEFGEECKGCYVITVSSNNKPVLVHADKTPLTDLRSSTPVATAAQSSTSTCMTRRATRVSLLASTVS